MARQVDAARPHLGRNGRGQWVFLPGPPERECEVGSHPSGRAYTIVWWPAQYEFVICEATKQPLRTKVFHWVDCPGFGSHEAAWAWIRATYPMFAPEGYTGPGATSL
jgi:hypothetical protein